MSALVSQQRAESTQGERALFFQRIYIEIRTVERGYCQQVKVLAFDTLIGVKAEYAGINANMHVDVMTVIGPQSSTN